MVTARWTEFVAQDRPGKIDRLCFGRPDEILYRGGADAEEQVCRFRPGQRFGVVWWRRYPDRSQKRTLMIAEATPAYPHPTLQLPGIRNAVTIYLMLEQLGPSGRDGVIDRFLDLLSLIRRQQLDPARVVPDYYQQLAYRIMAGQISRWRRFDQYLLEFPVCVM